VTDAIKDVATAVHGALDNLKPDVVEVELGLDLAVKAGKVLAMLVDAGSTASIWIRQGRGVESVVGRDDEGGRLCSRGSAQGLTRGHVVMQQAMRPAQLAAV
jgi:hypothetical protein